LKTLGSNYHRPLNFHLHSVVLYNVLPLILHNVLADLLFQGFGMGMKTMPSMMNKNTSTKSLKKKIINNIMKSKTIKTNI